MAHAASLGKVVAASAVCEPWPERTFRFTINTAGGVLTITTAEDHHGQAGRVPRGPVGQSDRVRAQRGMRPVPRMAPTRHAPVPGVGDARLADVEEFYRAMGQLARELGGPRRLRDSTRSSGWPPRGVYFFYEDGETRADGSGRVVRVGTHALTATSKATLWGRLRQHRGQLAGRNPGGGNHRASVYRRHVGAALIQRRNSPDGLLASWLDRHRPPGERAIQEAKVELEVSRYIGAMPFLWLSVADRADRGYIESNSIALLSRLTGGPDAPSASWLGRHAERAEIRESGLWNVEHVADHYKPDFLQRLAQLVDRRP